MQESSSGGIMLLQEEKDEIELIVLEKMVACRAEVDMQIDHLHEDMSQLRAEVHEFRTEFTAFSNALTIPLQKIALHMEQLAGLPEAWSNFKGFMGVMRWIGNNWLGIVSILAITGYGIYEVLSRSLGK